MSRRSAGDAGIDGPLRGEPHVAEPFLGEIRRWPVGPVPEGWQPCDGRELPVAAHPELFAVFGTEFGGDGVATFALPWLVSTASPDEQFIVAMHAARPARDR